MLTAQELGILKDIMEAAVAKAVAPLNEELKLIKKLNATLLKESRERPAAAQQPLQESPMFRQLPSVSTQMLEHKPAKSQDDVIREARRIVANSDPNHGLSEMEVSEDLLFSMIPKMKF